MANCSGTVWKELQRVASFVCYEKICKSTDTYNKAQKEDLAFAYYHGDGGENDCGFAQQLVQGSQMFEKMFEPLDIPILTGFELPTRLKLRLAFTKDNTKAIFLGTGAGDVTIEMLRRKNMNGEGPHIVGSTIVSHATMVQKNCRKAWAYMLQFLQKQTVPIGPESNKMKVIYVIPSGASPQDVVNFVNNKMFLHLKHGDEKVAKWIAEAVELPSPDEDYFWPGEFIFQLMGPMAEEQEQSTLIQPDPPAEATLPTSEPARPLTQRQRREQARANKAQKAAATRATGPTESDRVLLARHADLQQREHSMEVSYAELSTLSANLQREFELQMKMAQAICPKYKRTNPAWVRVDKLSDRLSAVNSQLRRDLATNKTKRVSIDAEHKKLTEAVTKKQKVSPTGEGGGDTNGNNTNNANVSTPLDQHITGPAAVSTTATSTDPGTDFMAQIIARSEEIDNLPLMDGPDEDNDDDNDDASDSEGSESD